MGLNRLIKLSKNKHIKYSLVSLFIFIILIACINSYRNKRLPLLCNILNNSEVVNEIEFYKLTFEFKNLSDILTGDYEEFKDKKFFVHRKEKDLWFCDMVLNIAYRPLPIYDFLKRDYIIRLVPDKISIDKISSLNGIYVCACYINHTPYKMALTNAILLNVNKIKKVPLPIFIPSNKKVKYTRIEPGPLEKANWLNFMLSQYPHKPIPQQQTDQVFLAHSIPQGLGVYTAHDYEVEACIIDNKLNKNLLISKIINKEHFKGLSPVYIDYKLHTRIFVIYSFVSPSINLINDGYTFEFAEPVANKNVYKILRGYRMDFMAEKHVNIINSALIQIKGLSPKQIINYIGDINTFEINEELYDLYIHPILDQAAIEKTDPSYDVTTCKQILAHAGKLNIETIVNNYLMSISRHPSGKNGIHTYGKCTNILMNDKKVLRELPKFYYKN